MQTPSFDFTKDENYQYPQSFAYRIDDEVKIITRPGPGQNSVGFIKTMHNIVYSPQRYETELVPLNNWPRMCFIYNKILTHNKFLIKPDVDLQLIESNLKATEKAMQFFEIDINNPNPDPMQTELKLPPIPSTLSKPPQKTTFLNPDDIRDGFRISKNIMNKPNEYPFVTTCDDATNENIEGYNDVSTLYALSETLFPENPAINGNVDHAIYYNKHFNTAIIVDASVMLKEYRDTIFPELQILFELDNSKMSEIDELKKILPNLTFLNEMDCTDYLDAFIFKKHNRRIASDDAKRALNKLYQITAEPEHKIKFSEIYNRLKEYMKLNDENSQILKHILPNILLEIGLHKKRITSGIYYYGCIEKTLNAEPGVNVTKPSPTDGRDYGYVIIDVNKPPTPPLQPGPDDDPDDKINGQ